MGTRYEKIYTWREANGGIGIGGDRGGKVQQNIQRSFKVILTNYIGTWLKYMIKRASRMYAFWIAIVAVRNSGLLSQIQAPGIGDFHSGCSSAGLNCLPN